MRHISQVDTTKHASIWWSAGMIKRQIPVNDIEVLAHLTVTNIGNARSREICTIMHGVAHYASNQWLDRKSKDICYFVATSLV